MPSPKFIYFDLGNVLLSFSHVKSVEQIAALTCCPYDEAWNTLFGASKLELQYETGLLTSTAFHSEFCRLTGTRSDEQLFLHATSAIFEPLWGTIALAGHLRSAGYRLGILSNTCEGHWHYCLKRFAFLQWYFAKHCLSYEEKSMKPDRLIYERACYASGCVAKDIFFVDDREENVAAAKEVGLIAVQFVSTSQFARDLTACGVRTNF